ncbi:MAG: MBL fold metallo-hydrolase [Deltaproteobacteria bacterium]|nr:MBL fold metallo-hydrolase [Deltaproteobacteria bacterium]
MKFKFWGVRGSIACPGPDTVHFGGNTTCIELRFDEVDRLVIIDAGSGIRLLGHEIAQSRKSGKPFHADIFITHTHWDHIMGFPFFDPIYLPETHLNIYGPVTYEEEPLERVIGGQLSYRYFPVLHSDLAADLNYYQIGENEIDLGDGIVLKTKYLNHTLLCLGYRFEFKGKSFCTAFDNEPFRNLFASDPESPDFDPDLFDEGEVVAQQENNRIIDFYRGADVLVFDAQYTQKEFVEGKQGWGHSFFEHAIDTAKNADVKNLYLFHHDPFRTDTELLALEAKFKNQNKDPAGPKLFIAKEGDVIDM